ncbi:MAG: hypothetical protein GY940_46915, partial [bacterium]|nr:hypothetical protein [bacterium]
IRGYRIELEGIASHLMGHSQVKEALVVAKETRNAALVSRQEEIYLCAYFTAEKELPLDELKKYLSLSLPGYMIPSYFMPLEKIPLMANDKIDRKALPAPGIKAGAGHISPSGDREKQLVAIWSEVLAVDKNVIGIHSNFFDLGGTSLVIIRLNKRVQDAFGKKIPVIKMFEYPSISSFLQYLDEMEGALRINKEEQEIKKASPPGNKKPGTEREIAVIGMSARFPGAGNIDELWQNLTNGVESISFLSDEEIRSPGFPAELSGNPNYVKA